MVHTAGGYSNYREYSYPLQLDGMNFYYGVIPNIDSPVPIYTLVVGKRTVRENVASQRNDPTLSPNPDFSMPRLAR